MYWCCLFVCSYLSCLKNYQNINIISLVLTMCIFKKRSIVLILKKFLSPYYTENNVVLNVFELVERSMLLLHSSNIIIQTRNYSLDRIGFWSKCLRNVHIVWKHCLKWMSCNKKKLFRAFGHMWSFPYKRQIVYLQWMHFLLILPMS